MRVLALTTLYPTPDAPHRAGFMPGRLAALAAHVDLVAVVPEQTFPFRRARPSETPQAPWPLYRPTFFGIPGVGRNRRPAAIERGAWPLVQQLHGAQPFEVVLGHFLYPDGVAAARLAARLGLPWALVAHGSDVYQHGAVPARSRQIGAALAGAGAVIAVSAPLAARIVESWQPPTAPVVLPCGYDPGRFAPRPRDEARAELRLGDGPWLLFCGMLRRLKRVDVILEALARLPSVRLAIVGQGPEAARLADQARRLDLEQRVLFVGPQPHARLPIWYAAADCVVLASESEGTPTVLVEAMAMGRPVVATRVGGVADLVGDLASLVPVGDAGALVAAVESTLAAPPDAAALRARVAHLQWPCIGSAEAQVLESVVSCGRRRP